MTCNFNVIILFKRYLRNVGEYILKNHYENPYFTLSLTGFISLSLLLVSTIVSIVSGKGFDFFNICKLSVYSICIVLSVITILNPTKKIFFYVGLVILCISDIFRGNEISSLVFLTIIVCLLLNDGFFNTYSYIKMAFVFLFWGILFISDIIFFEFDLDATVYFFSVSVFCAGTFCTLYRLFKSKLDYQSTNDIENESDENVGINIGKNAVTEEANIEEKLNLKKEFNKRQLYCMKKTLDDTPIKDIAKSCVTSESSIKRDFSIIYKKLNLHNREELRKYLMTDDLIELL